MKKTILCMLLLWTGNLIAQDTIRAYVDSNFYMFQQVGPYKYSSCLEDTINGIMQSTSMLSAGPAGLGGTFLQAHTPIDSSVVVVGIAVTMKPYTYDKETGMVHPGFPVGQDLDECKRYRVILTKALPNTSFYPNMCPMEQLDSMYYDDLTVTRKNLWFNYGTNAYWNSFYYDGKATPCDDSIAPCIEFYFNKPYGTYTFDSTFYVGTRHMHYLTYDKECEDRDHFYSVRPFISPGEFFAVYGKDTAICYWHTDSFNTDVISTTPNSMAYASGRIWGLVFPIIGFHCRQEVTGIEDSCIKSTAATLRWDGDGGSGDSPLYEVQLTYTKKWEDTTFITTDTMVTVNGLVPKGHYRWRVRRSCRYTTTVYDTAVMSERWSPYYEFTLPETDPIDTTSSDTTIVDTTSINLAFGESSFSIYPNPTFGLIQLKMQPAISADAELSLYDMRGYLVYHRTLPRGTRDLRLDIRHFPKGSYMLSLSSSNGSVSHKIVLK